MALLSNEETLFKELNLVSSNTETNANNEIPRDFYKFLLHKLTKYFQYQLSKSEIIDIKTNGNYERLSNFVWDRSLKKNYYDYTV